MIEREGICCFFLLDFNPNRPSDSNVYTQQIIRTTAAYRREKIQKHFKICRIRCKCPDVIEHRCAVLLYNESKVTNYNKSVWFSPSAIAGIPKITAHM